jgi:hypothetical protein
VNIGDLPQEAGMFVEFLLTNCHPLFGLIKINFGGHYGARKERNPGKKGLYKTDDHQG